MQARSSLSGGEISMKRRHRRRKKLCITARTTVRAPSDSLTRTETTRPSVVSLPAPGPTWSAMQAVSSITTEEPEWRCLQAWTRWAITECSGFSAGLLRHGLDTHRQLPRVSLLLQFRKRGGRDWHDLCKRIPPVQVLRALQLR